MAYKGAGGTDGGTLEFIAGFVMMTGGLYLLLSEMIVRPQIGFGAPVYSIGGWTMTTGMVFIPFLFGVAMIFYKGRSLLGWALALGSVISLIFGVIANLNIQMSRISVFDLIVIFVLVAGGLGLLLRSLWPRRRRA